MTFLIAVPTGVKLFNWLATMWRGKLTFSTPMLFAVGFLAMFLIGGLDGAFRAVGALRLRAPGHVLGGRAPALRAVRRLGVRRSSPALYYWFPKMTGRMLDERLGKVQFVLLFIGTNLTFFPKHLLGLDGMPRRIVDYAAERRLERAQPRWPRSARS